jgi:mannose-6-phosphate isomerase
VAIGFREAITPARLESSAMSGEIEELLDWRKVSKGDLIFVPAGTVHAIGAGVTVCEIQENSDITYRLYDYGRPRELHLAHGKQVSRLTPYQEVMQSVELSAGRTQKEACSYFRIEHLAVPREVRITGNNDPYMLLVCLRGQGSIAATPVKAGEAWFVPAKVNQFVIQGAGTEWILAYKADEPYAGIQIS